MAALTLADERSDTFFKVPGDVPVQSKQATWPPPRTRDPQGLEGPDITARLDRRHVFF